MSESSAPGAAPNLGLEVNGQKLEDGIARTDGKGTFSSIEADIYNRVGEN